MKELKKMLQAEQTAGPSTAGTVETIHLFGFRTCDIPACSIVPRRFKLPHQPDAKLQ
jgi:hypothetical protein